MPKLTATDTDSPDLLTQARAALAAAEKMQLNPYTESADFPGQRARILAALAHVAELRLMNDNLSRIAAALEGPHE